MKKTLNNWFFLGLSLSSIACNSTPETPTNPAENTSPPANKTAPTPETAATPTLIDARADSTIQITFPANDSSVTILGELHTVNQEIMVSVPVQDKRRLSATLLPPDSLPNIRFAQVIRPNGEAEGPLDKSVSIPTPQNGTYTLRISHNLRTEAALTKEFKLRVAVSQ